MALRSTAVNRSAQKLLVKQRMREREGKEFIPGRIIWDEVTKCGPANWPIKPPQPMMGPLGWRVFFHERELHECNKDIETALFSYRVHSAIQDEFAKIEAHPPPVASHHQPGGKLLLLHQRIDSERPVQTSCSIPKDKYEMERYIKNQEKLNSSDMTKAIVRDRWMREQERMFRHPAAGCFTEDGRYWENIMEEDEYGRHFGARIAQAFIFAWVTLILVSLIWRIK
eukprot:Sspe_Gene.1929::Locus_642_Transcript_2_3_Confidence_0.500_Length_803::g.1929::m.1929